MAVKFSSSVPPKGAVRPAPRRAVARRDGAAAQKPGDVFVSRAASVASPSCSIPDIQAIHTLKNINQISGDGLSYFNDGLPSWQYQRTDWHTRQDGSQYSTTSYDWGAAFADVRSKLQAIADVASNSNDSRSQEIGQLANNALQSNDWQYFLDEGSDESRYAQLQDTLSNINTLTNNTPNEPQTTINSMNGAIGNANKAIADLRNTLQDPTLTASNLPQKVQAKVDQYNQKASSIPWWHYLLLFGFFEKSGDHGTANRLQQDLKTVQSANPGSLQQQLDGIASNVPAITQQACNTTTVDGASQLQSTAQPVTDGANSVASSASNQNNQGQDLIKTVNSK